MMRELITSDVFEVVLNHNRYTLLDRGAEPLIEEALARGIAYVNAAPYGSGMLAKGPSACSRYEYAAAPPAYVRRARQMEATCAAHGVPLPAAALQFSLRDPRIALTSVGMSRPERVADTLRLAAWDVPAPLWDELDAIG
jgi:D-threo-aldose 1-dehydrogenase